MKKEKYQITTNGACGVTTALCFAGNLLGFENVDAGGDAYSPAYCFIPENEFAAVHDLLLEKGVLLTLQN